jgi:acetyl esterase/lipase
MSDGHAVEMLPDIAYVRRPDGALSGDLFRPIGVSAGPICVAVHGGGWRLGQRQYFRHLAPYLAARGVAVFAISYRLASAAGHRYPAAVHDVRAAIQFLRQNAEHYDIDPDRIGLIGSSAGGHLVALVALAGDLTPFAGAADDAFPGVSCRVKAAVPIYGVFDMLAQWRFDLIRPYDRLVENFLGLPPMEDKRIYHEASPLTYTTIHARKTSFLLVWGTADDRVDYTTQSLPFLEALKQSGYFVRTVIVGDAPHYWAGEPLDEPGSASGFMAPRLARFLHERL